MILLYEEDQLYILASCSSAKQIKHCICSNVSCVLRCILQIMMHEKESLGMGIVEFRKAEDAEETWEKLRNTKIEGSDITLTFCIPSKSAVVINNRIMWKFVRSSFICLAQNSSFEGFVGV